MGDREDFAEAFAANLVVARSTLGLSQERFAQALDGPSLTTVGRWERGQLLPDAYEIFRICAVLEIAPNDLLAPRELSPVERALIRRGRSGVARAALGSPRAGRDTAP